MMSPIWPSVGSQSDQKTVASPFSGSYKKKNLNENLEKKIIIKPLTRPKPNANKKAQYKINLISD